jgi:hypothetical protein
MACDLISLSLQGAGGGVAASATTMSSMTLGNRLMLVGLVGHGGSLTTEVRRVLFDVRIRRYQYSLNLYHHSLGTPVGGQFSYVY